MGSKIYILETKNTHYVVGADEAGIVRHIHWGKKAMAEDYCIPEIYDVNSNHSALDRSLQEYTVFGGTMYRECAFKCEYFDKCRDSVFTFKSAKQGKGSLDITLCDEKYDIDIILSYRYSDDTDIITRFATVVNNSQNSLKIDRLMSAELTLPDSEAYDVTNTNGSWASEFLIQTTSLKCGTLTFDSKRGTAGHVNSPFVIMSQNATEDSGDVFFAGLGWGGNFKAEVNRDFIGRTRALLGMSDFDFSYTLKAGESITTPKVYIGYSNGFADMSNMMNEFAVENILPKSFANKPLPVLYNSWEATGFNVNSNNQMQLAKLASEIGCELFVIDDGWFGKRNNDRAGLGDWFVNDEKFPNGLKELIDFVNELGMDFGIWFEPEMVQKDSDLFRAHPDWIYHYDTRKSSELRHQLVLNLTKDEVKQYVFDCMDNMLSNYNIKYIKWDMNRPFSQIGAENLENQQEIWYRHTMAVYDIADRLKEKYPYLQLEACSSGGGRAEYGAMEHFDMVWTSDNTDPVDRLDIQRGYSLIYPIKCMRAWVTDWSDNARPVPLDFRFNSAMQGSLSIGSNLLKYSVDDIEKCKHYISLYKSIRDVVQFGDFYRLKNYDENEYYATQYVSRDKNKSVVFINASCNYLFNKQFKTIKLKGLDDNALYKLADGENEVIKSGAYFNNMSYDFRLDNALTSKIWILEKQ
jgi:alpha-galactosidase